MCLFTEGQNIPVCYISQFAGLLGGPCQYWEFLILFLILQNLIYCLIKVRNQNEKNKKNNKTKTLLEYLSSVVGLGFLFDSPVDLLFIHLYT